MPIRPRWTRLRHDLYECENCYGYRVRIGRCSWEKNWSLNVFGSGNHITGTGFLSEAQAAAERWCRGLQRQRRKREKLTAHHLNGEK